MSSTKLRSAATWTAVLLTCSLSGVSAGDQKAKNSLQATPEQELPTFSLLEAMDKGLVGVEAEGIGDGRMTVSVTNHTKGQLRVVLPPGLVAQGASGQMGGMGGMGGGMGGGG